MKILLFGSTGLVGVALLEELDNRGIDVIGLSHADVDITTDCIEDTILYHNPSIVINSVMFGGPRQCTMEPVRAFNVHLNAVMQMADICNNHGITYAHISTSNIFDGKKALPYDEYDMPNPLHLYGALKYGGEQLVMNRCSKYFIFRLPVVFGARANKRLGILDKMWIWLHNKDVVYAADDMFDTPSYNRDIAVRIADIIEHGTSDVYHVCNDGTASYYDYATALRDELGLDTHVERASWCDFGFMLRPINLSFATKKMLPMRSWKNALKKFVEKDGSIWTKKH